jgi:protein-S-isoprenylcysteine O-methyltransferase Ste14
MASKDSLVNGNIFGGVSKGRKRGPAAVQHNHKGGKAKKGATFPALEKMVTFLEQLTAVFVQFAKTVRCLSGIIVSLIGLALVLATLVFIIQALCLGRALPVEALVFPVLRVCLSQIR